MNIKKIKPLFNRIVTTRNLYDTDVTSGSLITTQKGAIKEYQEVLEVGPTVKDIKVGDLVCVNPTRYLVSKHNPKSMKDGVIGDNMTIKVDFPTIIVDGKVCLLLYDSDIDYIIVEGEEDTSTNIINTGNKIIV